MRSRSMPEIACSSTVRLSALACLPPLKMRTHVKRFPPSSLPSPSDIESSPPPPPRSGRRPTAAHCVAPRAVKCGPSRPSVVHADRKRARLISRGMRPGRDCMPCSSCSSVRASKTRAARVVLRHPPPSVTTRIVPRLTLLCCAPFYVSQASASRPFYVLEAGASRGRDTTRPFTSPNTLEGPKNLFSSFLLWRFGAFF